MPIIRSAKKRVKQTAKATARNAQIKKSLRGAVKSLQAAIASGGKQKIKQAHSKVDSVLDTATKKKLFHKNKSARKKSQIAKLVKAGANQKTPVKKSTSKKTASGQTTTKRTLAESATKPKATAAKKPAAKKDKQAKT